MIETASSGHPCACGTWVGNEVDPEYVVASPWGLVQIQRCPSCRLAQSAQFPTREEQTTLYEGNQIYRPLPEEQFQKVKDSGQHVVCDLQKLSLTSGRILEVGCNVGYSLVLFRQHGFDVTGVEKNVACAEYARDRHRLRVFDDLSEIPLGERFQIVYLSHLVEHVVDINEFMRTLRRLLVSDSILYIKVPNYGSIFAKYILRNRWHAFIPRQHVWYFEKLTLTQTFSRHGYMPVRVYTRAFANDGTSLHPFKRLARQLLGPVEKMLDCGQEIVGIYRRTEIQS